MRLLMLLMFICLCSSSFALYCSLDSLLLTFTFQVVILFVESLLFFIPAAFVPKGENCTIIEWIVRTSSLVIGNYWLCCSFSEEDTMPIVFVLNGFLFFFVSFIMIGTEKS